MLPTARRLLGRAALSPRTSLTRSTLRPALFSTAATRQASQADLHKAPSSVDQFATGNNAYYAEEMYRAYKEVSELL